MFFVNSFSCSERHLFKFRLEQALLDTILAADVRDIPNVLRKSSEEYSDKTNKNYEKITNLPN